MNTAGAHAGRPLCERAAQAAGEGMLRTQVCSAESNLRERQISNNRPPSPLAASKLSCAPA